MGEPWVIWGGSALLVAAIVLPYFVQFRRRNRRDGARKAEAERLGTDKAVAQYPFVDPALCIGCGACVDACPEYDVLGVVGGTATVINGMRCVGHGACERACPVGAIEVGLGDVKSRADIPVTDGWHETSVPGLFVVGELGGLALIRNAVSEGTRAVERIAQRQGGPGRGDGVLDLAVVGAGPAGLSAALAAVERRLTHVVLEQETSLGGTVLHYPRRKLVLVQQVDLPLGGRLKEAEYGKEEILDLMQRLIVAASLEIRFGERVQSVTRGSDGIFEAGTTKGSYRARSLILALGRRGSPRKLGVPGEELPKVMYKLMDADSYQGQALLIVGGGDSAVEAAIGLSRDGRNDVTLSYRRERIVRIKRANEERLAPLIRANRLRLLLPSEVEAIHERVVSLRAGGGNVELPNDYVFVFAGGEAPLPLLRRAGVRFGGDGNPGGVPSVSPL
jgi:thioredoxin reductase